MIHTFYLVLDRQPTDDELDKLFEAGCDDAAFSLENDRVYANFDREAPSIEDAVDSAVANVLSCGIEVKAVLGEDRKLLLINRNREA